MIEKNIPTNIDITEEQLQKITGGTPADAAAWLRNLPAEHRALITSYKASQPIPESLQAQAIALSTQYTRVYRAKPKILSDGSIASTVGQLRPKQRQNP
jgi:hypothetical protein